MREYDLIIVGKGAAAFAAAIKATELSEGRASILMVGKGPLGGTCVNVGCVPSKYLLELSHRYYYARKGGLPGLTLSAGVEFGQVMGAVRGLIAKLREEKYERVIKSYGNVELVSGEALFTSPSSISMKGDYEFEARAKNFIVATGSRPSVPPLEGLEKVSYLTSDSVWQLERLPSSLVLIGGGAIGLELGQAFLHFGSQVSVVEALPRIAYTAEPEMSEALQHLLEAEGMRFYLRSRVASLRPYDGGVSVEVFTRQGRVAVEGEALLIATGRKPNTEGLGLERAKVELDERGAIKVDARLRTSNPRIFAAGDVISKQLMLETLAAREGVVAATNALGGRVEVDYMTAPWVIFTNPNLAAVGLTEAEVTKRLGACSCRVIGLEAVAKSHILGQEKGLAKLVVDPGSGRIMGAQVLAPGAAEFITEVALAMRAGMTYRDLIEATHAFPTVAEVIKLAAQPFIRDISRMSCCVE